MSSSTSDPTISDTAISLLLRLLQNPSDDAVKAEVINWENSNPQHAQAMLNARRIWNLAGQIEAQTKASWPVVPQLSTSEQDASDSSILPTSITCTKELGTTD